MTVFMKATSQDSNSSAVRYSSCIVLLIVITVFSSCKTQELDVTHQVENDAGTLLADAGLVASHSAPAPVTFNKGNACGIGTYTAWYESFTYRWISGARDTSIVQPGGLFGPTAWHSCEGSVQATDTLLGWYRYNETQWGNETLHAYDAGVELTFDGADTPRSNLVMTLDTTYAGGWGPVIRSRFASNEGIYVARVKFDHLQESNGDSAKRIYQAFWLDDPTEAHPYPAYRTPGQYKEIDYEWTNVFPWRGAPNGAWVKPSPIHEGVLTVNLHTKGDNELDQRGLLRMDCAYVSHEPMVTYSAHEGCFVGEDRTRSYIVGDGEPWEQCQYCDQPVPPGNEYWTLAIKYVNAVTEDEDVSTGIIEFLGKNDGYRGRNGTFWLGDTTGSDSNARGAPVVIDETQVMAVDPDQPMNVIFSMHTAGAGAVLDKAHTMTIDWVYFSDDAALMALPLNEAIEVIEQEAVSLAASGYYHVNTAGLEVWQANGTR